MVKKIYMDDEERDIIEAYKRGEFMQAPDEKIIKAALKKAARIHGKKSLLV